MRTHQYAHTKEASQSFRTPVPRPTEVQASVQPDLIQAKSNEEGLAEHAERLRKFQRLGNSMMQMGPPRLDNNKTSSLQPQPWIQKKLTIGKPGDKYEQEADRVASQVAQHINAPTFKENSIRESIQREKDLEGVMCARGFQAAIQRKQAIESGEASADLEFAINSVRGSGQPLDAGLQQSMGQAMGADFSGVRVHTDAQSNQLNQSIQARAFTAGQDVFFREGAYQPENRRGQELIAHELAHVKQTGGSEIKRFTESEIAESAFNEWEKEGKEGKLQNQSEADQKRLREKGIQSLIAHHIWKALDLTKRIADQSEAIQTAVNKAAKQVWLAAKSNGMTVKWLTGNLITFFNKSGTQSEENTLSEKVKENADDLEYWIKSIGKEQWSALTTQDESTVAAFYNYYDRPETDMYKVSELLVSTTDMAQGMPPTQPSREIDGVMFTVGKPLCINTRPEQAPKYIGKNLLYSPNGTFKLVLPITIVANNPLSDWKVGWIQNATSDRRAKYGELHYFKKFKDLLDATHSPPWIKGSLVDLANTKSGETILIESDDGPQWTVPKKDSNTNIECESIDIHDQFKLAAVVQSPNNEINVIGAWKWEYLATKDTSSYEFKGEETNETIKISGLTANKVLEAWA